MEGTIPAGKRKRNSSRTKPILGDGHFFRKLCRALPANTTYRLTTIAEGATAVCFREACMILFRRRGAGNT